MREKVYLEDPSVNGKIMLKWVVRKWNGMGRVLDRAGYENKERWRALVNAVMNLLVPLNTRNLLTS